MRDITLIIPYYNQPAMLRKQLEVAHEYPDQIKVIVVDDGSPTPAEEVFEESDKAQLFRIDVDVHWNREEARNLGAYVAQTEWLIQVDIDHVLPPECAEKLVEHPLEPLHWYRFPRWRVGAADFTRKKDAIHHRRKFGKIHPHQDSYLIRRQMFFTAPYNEQLYAGILGGGTPFLQRMIQIHGEPPILPDHIHLQVYTTDAIKDASIQDLSRDTSEYSRIRKASEATGTDKPTKILLQPWHKVR